MAGLAGALISGVITSRAELHRDRSNRQGAYTDRVRSHLTEVLRLMFLAETEIYSVCWLAASIPQRLDRHRIALYERRTHATLPQLSAAMVILAGLDTALYRQLLPWAEKLDSFEGRAARSLYGDVPDFDVLSLAGSAADRVLPRSTVTSRARTPWHRACD